MTAIKDLQNGPQRDSRSSSGSHFQKDFRTETFVERWTLAVTLLSCLYAKVSSFIQATVRTLETRD